MLARDAACKAALLVIRKKERVRKLLSHSAVGTAPGFCGRQACQNLPKNLCVLVFCPVSPVVQAVSWLGLYLRLPNKDQIIRPSIVNLLRLLLYCHLQGQVCVF